MSRAGVFVLSGGAAEDTIHAPLPPLVVEVRDRDGRPVATTPVTFTTSRVQVGGLSGPGVMITPPGGTGWIYSATATTDAAGRATAQLRLGRVPGVHTVTILAQSIAYEITVSYTVRPGAPVSLSASPADTAIVVGRAYAPRIRVLDRMGNPIPDAVPTLTPASGLIVVEGDSIRGVATGRTTLDVSSSGGVTRLTMSVVPEGRLLAIAAYQLIVFDTDGGDLRTVATEWPISSARWMPDGETIVYTGWDRRIRFTTASGPPRRLTDGSKSHFELAPRPSRDGAWVYFSGQPTTGGPAVPYRARADGSAMELPPGYSGDDASEGHPSPSPDGERIVYERAEWPTGRLRVLAMRDGTLLSSHVAGHAPEWSHGDSIAYLLDGAIHVMDPLGSGRRVAAGRFRTGMDWSPDDRWIVAVGETWGSPLELIELSTGRRIPLSYSAGWSEPAWRP